MNPLATRILLVLVFWVIIIFVKTLILGKQRLQKWTRGCFGIVNSAGFIRYWAPLFKSEGPAQVAVIVLTFLLTILGPSVPFVDWEKLGLLI